MPGVSGVTVVTTLVCFFTFAREAAARRAPGIPCALISLGRTIHASLGRRSVARMRRCVLCCLNLNQLLVVPDKRAKASADPGPIATNVRSCAKSVEQRVSKQAIRRMGPRFRGDDVQWLVARGRHSHSDLPRNGSFDATSPSPPCSAKTPL